MSVWTELPAAYFDNVEQSTFVGLVVANTNPEENSTDVDISSGIIRLDILNTSGDALDLPTVVVYLDAVQAFAGGVFSAGYDGPQSSYTADGLGGLQIVIDASVAFGSMSEEQLSEAVITARVLASTSGFGATFSVDYSYSFTTEDIVRPELVTARATYANVIRVTFTEAMLAASVTGANDALNPSNYTFTFLPANDRQAGVSVLAASVEQVSDAVFDITTDIELTFWKRYRITCGDIADAAPSGNLLKPASRTFEFASWFPPNWPTQRSFSLWEMFSDDDRDRDYHGDLERLLAALQDVVDILLWSLDRMATIWDVDRCDSRYLPAMLADLGNPFDLDLSENRQRKLAAVLVDVFKQKGTEDGIINVVRFFLGIEITTITAPNVDGWLLGEQELGVGTYLGPGDRASLYTFHVLVGESLSDEDRRIMERLVQYMKPAHTHFVIVEPSSPIFIDHWSLGESELGTETYLHA